MTNDKIKEAACEEADTESEQETPLSNEERIKTLLIKTDLIIAKCKSRNKKKKIA